VFPAIDIIGEKLALPCWTNCKDWYLHMSKGSWHSYCHDLLGVWLNRDVGVWIGHSIYCTHPSQYLITPYNLAPSPIHTVCSSLYAHWVLFVFCPTPVLWYRFPTADVHSLGFQNCPRPTETATHSALSIFCSLLLLSRSVLSGALLITDWLVRFRIFCYRRSVGQSVFVSDPHDQIFITVRYLRSSCCTAPSLTRGRVCNLLVQFTVSPVQVSQNSWPHFTVSCETPPTWRARSLCLYPPGTGWPSYALGHLAPS
jgi:hypothetical protein